MAENIVTAKIAMIESLLSNYLGLGIEGLKLDLLGQMALLKDFIKQYLKNFYTQFF